MMSQNGQQIITMHILLNISRSKDNQTMKFDRFIEYGMRIIFLEKHTQIWVEKLVPDPFIKKMSISLDQQSEML